MDFKKSKRFLILLAAIYWLLVIGIYAVGNEQFRYVDISGESISPEFVIHEITDDMVLSQNVIATTEMLDSIEIMAGTYARENSGSIQVKVMDSAGVVVAEAAAELAGFEDNAYNTIAFEETTQVEVGHMLSICIRVQNCTPGNAIAIYAGTVMENGEVAEPCLVNETEGEGALCVRLNGRERLPYARVYWSVTAAAFALFVVLSAVWWKAAKQGKSNPLVSVCTVYSGYSFLIKQLVSRDFKTKYKRSTLGMAWSFLNPLLTMSVQYVVFSTLFRSDIPNYPVYLLTGIVLFSFFNEAITMGMTSITGNATLIKKVYMPKYIYPVSRILSSLVNFAFALMPLFLVMLITGTPFKASLFLLIFDIICLLAFITGMTLLLTTAMTFFQDTLFLWSVVSMMWQYLTPLFYPETIIPTRILPLYRLNPLYRFVSFARTCIIEGVSPDPVSYIYCLGWAIGVLLLGILVFKKHQNKFVLYI